MFGSPYFFYYGQKISLNNDNTIASRNKILCHGVILARELI
jgi:hypothetical protein